MIFVITDSGFLYYFAAFISKQKGASVLARRAKVKIVFEEAEVKLVRPELGREAEELSRRRRNAAPG